MREFSHYTFHMDYDFRITQEQLRIPSTSYRPVKRCPFCKSVFINEKSCESCGRSLQYHPIGVPFGPKSMYGIKERYVESLNLVWRIFPFLENKKSSIAKSYVRKLEKRFTDLISAFNSLEIISNDQRKLFFIESKEIIDELLRYGINSAVLQALLLENDSSLVGQELYLYLQGASVSIQAEEPWHLLFLNYRVWGILKVDYMLKVSIITATILIMAVEYKEIISSQFGR